MSMSNVQPLDTHEANDVVIDYSEMEQVYLRDVFKPFIPPQVDLIIERPKHVHPDVPKEVKGYIPDTAVLKQVLAWFLSPSRPNFLHMCGPTGSGKTDFIFWFAHRMNWPCKLVTVNPSLRPEKMQGRWMLSGGETSYVLGAVADSMKYGKIALLDEADKGSLDFIAKMHLPAEMSKPWTIDDTGETIYPAENYRFITTGNTNGQGDFNGLYPSSRRWDTAFRNRSYVIHLNYVEPNLEFDIIMGKHPELKAYKKTVRMMIKFSNAMRDAMLGPKRDGDIQDGITTAFSTRVLLSWCHYIIANGFKVPLRNAFDSVFMNGVDNDDREDITRIVDQVFHTKAGHVLDEGMGWLEESTKKA
ncbi:AAA family ATPase [uncultured Photobacterium sp.]|uniref:AAA family ATPase n=1 Tax=uncultured Photobacterium sp. TaxID=173973 RepID=UPI0026017427|nr:AAA family ATPase [uncultured Photobacterium sp.]